MGIESNAHFWFTFHTLGKTFILLWPQQLTHGADKIVW